MGWFQDFLNSPLGQRLEQHAGSEIAPYAGIAQQDNPVARILQGLLVGTTALPKTAIDTTGLGLEGFSNIAQAATGGGLLALADHADQIPGLSANDKAVLQQAAAVARAGQGGPLGGLQSGMDITNYVRQHADTPLAWGTGASALGLDLSNFLPLGKLEDAGKALLGPAKGAVLGALKGGEAPAVLAKVGDLAPETAAKIAQLPRQEIPSGSAIEQAVAKLTGAAGAAPEAAPVKGPLKTIFGEDASVVHSGTYPGKPQAASAASGDVQQAVARLTGDVPAPVSAQEAAALAPDASVNDKFNALEQNPNLSVPQGSAPSINTFSKLFEAAYGSARRDQRRNAIPAMEKMLGAQYRTDGTFWRNGVDVTQPALDFLAQRATLGNDRKAIAAARDVAKQAANQLVGDAPGGLPGSALLPFATAVGGAAAGAGVGYQQDGVSGALKGAALGGLAGAAGGAGLEKIPYGTLGDVAQLAGQAGKEGFANAQANGTLSLKALANDWAADKTKVITGRTNALDELSNRVRSLVNKIPMARINGSTKSIIERTKAAGGTVVPRSQETDDFLQALGFDPNAFDYADMYGQGYFGKAGHGTNVLPPAASAAAGVGYSLLNPTTYLTGGLGALAAGARGYFRGFTSGAVEHVNDLQHFGVRDAGFLTFARQAVQDAATEFLGRLQQQGVNTAGLDARGLFTPADVEAVAPGNGAVWQNVLDQIIGTPAVKNKAGKVIAPQVNGLGSQWVKQVFGDYSKQPKGVLGALSKVAPFSRYTLGQLPVTAALIAQHPAAMLAVAHLLRDANNRARQTGTPSYNANNLDVPNSTPVLGGLAALEAGAPAKGSLNLVNAISPVNVDVAGLGDVAAPKTNYYQKATAILNAIGLQPNPLIQTAAYVLGADPYTPGAQSRYSGLENALGGPQIPTIKTALDNARQAVSGQYPDNYDPAQVYIAEQVLAQTGKPLKDPSNHDLAVQAQDPNSPLYQQAKAAVDKGGAIKNAVSVVSPVSLASTTDVKAQYRQAKASDPRYTKAQIAQAAQVSMSVARQMQAVNAAIEAQNPALVTYSTPKLTAQDKEDPRLKAFDTQYGNLKGINPKLYAAMLAEYKQQIGVK